MPTIGLSFQVQYVAQSPRPCECRLYDILWQLLAVAYPVLQIAIVKYGGGGKHMYDVTYHEFYMFNWV